MANGNSTLAVTLLGKDELSGTIKNAQKALTELNNKGSKLDSIQKNFDKIANSAAPLSKKVSDVKKQMQQLALSGGRTTAEGKRMWAELSKAANDYKKILKDVDKAVEDAGKTWREKFADKVGGLTKDMGLGGIGKNVTMALTNPYVAAGAAAVAATKAIYEYGAELDRTLQKTAQFTGLSGNELQSLRAGIQSVATTWGKDYDDVLSSVDGLMSQFGISAEEALQIVRNGFASGADDSGRMLDMISRYSGAFHDAGISADELVAIIQNTRSGIFSEDGMELFSKGATKIREFSDKLRGALENVGINADQMYQKLQSGEISTVQAIQQISVKLKELPPQSQEVGDVLKQVFGKDGAKAGYEMVTALADVETNLDVILEGLTEDQKATLALQEANREFEAALGSLFGTANGGFSSMTTKLKTEVYSAVAKVINGFIDWYNQSLQLRASIHGLALAFKNAWEFIKTIIKVYIDAVKAMGEITEGVFSLDWEKVKKGWNNGVSAILRDVATGFEKIKENSVNAWDEITNGRINHVTVAETVEYTKGGTGGGGSSTGGGGTGTGSGSNKGNKSGKEEPIKTQIELDREALKNVQNEVKQAFSDFNAGSIDKTQLEEIVKNANEYFKENKLKYNIDLEYFTNGGGFEQVREAVKKEALTPLQELEEAYKKAQSELASVDPTKIPREQLEELKENARNAKNAVEEMKKALSTEVTPSVKGVDHSNFEKGSSWDKKQSLDNANARASEVQELYKAKIINADEARKQLEEIRSELQGAFPDLDIELHMNDDGSIRTVAEDIEVAKNKMDSISGSISTMGSAFGSLGSAIGGTGGEILGFAGTTISAIGQIIPQIVSLIAAQNAEAIAAGTASGAAMPFPANIAAIASIIATIAGIFASLPKFATGGVVGGGSYTGDKVLARLNSGEGVLTRKGMNNLETVMNNSTDPGTLGGRVEFDIDGTRLRGVLNNVNKKLLKQS